MRSINLLTAILLSAAAYAQTPAAARDWTLPTSLTLKLDGPKSWRFVCDYYHLDTKGKITGRERFSGLYTRGLPGNKVRWNDVNGANATGQADLAPSKKRDFMEGFTYSEDIGDEMLKPEFFRGFPPTAMQERNLVWDTAMFEAFTYPYFDKLKLNVPYHMPEERFSLAGTGTFHNKDVQLTWTGISKRNGEECAVIDYRAFFNTLDVKIPGFDIVGRSHYWGQIWVSLSTKRIEYGTLYEDVLMDMTMQGQTKAQTINVFRIGVFEPSNK